MRNLNQHHEIRLEIETGLDIIEKLNGQIRLLDGLRTREQSSLLSAATSSESALNRAVVILGLIKNGATVRWHPEGWQLENTGVRVPSSLLNDMHRMGLVKGDNGIVVSADEFEVPPVSHERIGLESLLCDEWTRSLDKVSSVMWKRDQFVGSCSHIWELHRVYLQTLNPEIDGQLKRMRNRIAWDRAITGLFFAAFLNLFGVASTYRKGLVKRSVATVHKLLPGALP
jgi:hypothetical protein